MKNCELQTQNRLPLVANEGQGDDSIKHKKEYFAYDTGLDRLRLLTVTDPQNLTMNYSANGNITQKSDVGSVYDYDASGKPYQLTSVITSTGLVPDVEQTVSYTSFEQPAIITESPYQALFTYNADGQRAKMEVKENSNTILTRWYAGSRYTKQTEGSITKEFTWIGGDAYSAPCLAVTQSGATTYYYLLRDHLGTITHVTDASGNVVNEYNFDAWGRRRDKDDWSYTLTSEPSLLADRGFTGHEYLPWFKLYNMNGRLYDPVVGRFVEPDPVVQNAFSTQNLNRYSYALNNPLKYVDPSGWVMNPGFNSSVWTIIENAWNNTQSNYDMIYSYNDGRMTGGSSLAYSGEGNTYWYSATVGEWYRDSQGNPTEKNGNSAGFLTEFYSVTLPVLSNNVLSKSKSENWNLTADISSLSSLILSGIDYAANSSAGYSFKYSSSGSAAAEEAASQTLKSISKGAHVLGHGANIVNALAGIYTFKYSDQSWGDYGKLGVSLTSAGLSVFAYTAPIGLTIGFIDIAGGFNGFYDYLDNQHEFYKTTGGVMLPINGIPNYLRFKR